MNKEIEIGGKAKGLNKLKQLNFTVPDYILIQDLENCKSTIEDFIDKSNAKAFAVRSSSALEDGMEHSFAGQFETFLNISNLDTIIERVKACFESAKSDRVRSYSNAQDMNKDHSIDMTVIVQEMVKPKYSGVAFSANPVNNRTDQCVIQYVSGLGNQLVDGKTSANSIYLSKFNADFSDGHLLDIKIQNELKSGLIHLEQIEQVPIDIEWALDENNKLYWLQMRPITTISKFHPNELDSSISFKGETLTRANVGEMMPGHMTPLTISTFGKAIEVGIQHFYMESGIIDKFQEEHKYIKFFYNHGFISLGNLYPIADALLLPKYEYVEYSILGRSLDSRTTPDESFGFLKKCINQIKQIRYLSKAKKRLEWIEETVQKVKPPDSKKNKFIYEWIDKNLETLNKIYAYHYCTSARSGTIYTTILSIISGSPLYDQHAISVAAHFLKNIKGIDGLKVIEGLQDIRQLLIDDDDIDLSKISDKELVDHLINNNSPAGIAFINFLATHGHHCVREAELSEKDWSQDPIKLMKTLKVAPSTSPVSRQINFKELLAIHIPEMSWLKSKIFIHFIHKTRTAVAMRERSKSLSIKYQQFIKKAYLILSQNLMEKKIIDHVDDIFYLTHEEIGELLDGLIENPKKRIEQRKSNNAVYNKLHFKEIYTDYPYPIEHVSSERASNGTVVSQGKTKGKVRCIYSLDEAATLEPGDIMICKYTDIGWTPYFSIISGLITEIGSVLSHGAVIAREYGLPAVVNYSNALELYEDGQIIEIDTSKSTPITIIEETK
ncbi:MAG: PEP-utilizing enzyme [Saprospiraceae bacterium]|nr:PEP-utilizing enzyme [Saprospiraceae bacterium]